MCIIRLFSMGVMMLLAACATKPIFPQEIMNDVEMDTVAVNAWKEQTPYLSEATFVPHKVQLGGKILQVIRKPDGIVILAEEQPIDRYLGYGPTRSMPEGSFDFAVVLNGFPEVDMLQVGNQLAVVGTTDRSSPEVVGWMPRTLPHLQAQCLDLWKTQGFETDNSVYEGSMGYYSLEKQTFCREKSKWEAISTEGGHANVAEQKALYVHKMGRD